MLFYADRTLLSGRCKTELSGYAACQENGIRHGFTERQIQSLCMNKLHNKHGTDTDIGKGISVHSRDGTCRMPRDGTIRMPRDATLRMPRDASTRMPRDGTLRMPRDATISSVEGWYTGYNNLRINPVSNNTIRGSTRFRRRKFTRVNRPSGPVMGEVCPGRSLRKAF